MHFGIVESTYGETLNLRRLHVLVDIGAPVSEVCPEARIPVLAW